MKTDLDKITTPCIAYQNMAPDWDDVTAIMSSTKGMRDKGATYLPKYSASESVYSSRVNRTYLFEAYKDTVDRIVSKPFSRTMIVDGLPALIQPIVENADGKNTSLHELIKDRFAQMIAYGHDFLFVDHPSMNAAEVHSAADDARYMPYITGISAANMLYWRYDKNENGDISLGEIRFREHTTEKAGKYSERVVERIRVYTPDKYSVWRKKENAPGINQDDWIQEIVDQHHSFGAIPIVPVYAKQISAFESEPPLKKLLWKNLEHWVISSDHTNALYFSPGTWWIAGATDKERNNMKIGPSALNGSENSEARCEHIEPEGKSLQYLSAYLDKIETQMEVLGAQPFLSRRINVTATGQHQNESKSTADIQSWIQNMEKAVHTALTYAARWKKIQLDPDSVRVDIYSDFLPAIDNGSDNDMIKFLVAEHIITKETALIEMQRRDIIHDGIVATDEVDRAGAESDSEMTDLFSRTAGNDNETNEDEDNG